MAGEIDPVEFGRLLESVQELNRKLASHAELAERLDQRLASLESLRSSGKSAVIGLALGLVFAVYGLKEALGRIADWLTR